MKSLSQNIVEHAKRIFPKAVSYKGHLTDKQFCEIEKECDIDFYKLVGQDIRYTIRYKAGSMSRVIVRYEKDGETVIAVGDNCHDLARILGITPQAVSHGIHRGSKLYQVIEDGETE